MKASAAEQRTLLDLADLDAEIAKTAHSRKHLPEDAELADLATKLDAARDDVAASRVAVDDLTVVYERFDRELTGMADHVARDKASIESGATGHKAITELQRELESLERRRDALEGEMLELMEQQEATSTEADRAEATLLTLTEKELDLVAKRDAAAETVDARSADLAERRAALAATIDADLVGVYEKLRQRGQVGAGLVQARRCGACRMELDPRTLSRIAAADEDEVLRCEECGAIMIRTDHSGLPGQGRPRE
ncbi:C4-type zinc ribbon domain-containing protein [Gordonia sp. HY442]|uniref:zinc ribbon domain-containing protein n=1 Tax=Gordonia zhenghanii TaxID=2911516 RepID=UPI001F2F5437|nr:C4-type zinc ribbon domain-containing protein [Gordonia zhenghanii]MCF8607896.1 C4-type zinc ribbon domain-containing protein [Gordonia zhenghanii]